MPRGEERKRERKSAWLEVGLPILSVALVAAFTVLLSDIGSRIVYTEWRVVIAAAGVVGLAGACVLLWLRRQGRRIPAALIVFTGTLPWLSGLGGMRHRMRAAEKALEQADWSSHGEMALRGYASAADIAWLGVLLSNGLLGAIAVVLAVRTQGKRKRALTALGVACGLLACAGPALVVTEAPIVSLVALAAVVVAASLGFAAGRDAAFGAATSGVLAMIGACAVVLLKNRTEGFLMALQVNTRARIEIYETVAQGETALAEASLIAVAAAGVGALVIAAESLRRTGVAQTVSLVMVLLMTLALHRVTTNATMDTIERWTEVPWTDDLQLVRTDDYGREPWVVIDADARASLGGEPVDDVLAAVEAEQQRREEEHARYLEEIVEDEPAWLHEVEESPGHGMRSRGTPPPTKRPSNRYGPSQDISDEEVAELRRRARRTAARFATPSGYIDGCAIGGGRPLTAIADARTQARPLVQALHQFGSVTLVGRRLDAPAPPQSGPLPVLSNIALRDSLGAFSVWWPRGACNPNALFSVLLTVELGTEPVREVRDFETGEVLPFPEGIEEQRVHDVTNYVVLVKPREDVTVQHLADLAMVVLGRTHRYQLVVVDELPEREWTPLPMEIGESVAEEPLSFAFAFEEPALEPYLAEHRESLDACARRMLTMDPRAAADLHISFRADQAGEVIVARTMGGPVEFRALRACLSEAVRQWTIHELADQRVGFWVTLGEPPEPDIY